LIEDNWLIRPSEGSLVVLFGRRYVALEFGKTSTEARRIRDGLRSVSGRWPVESGANVAYFWSARMKRRVRPVLACLREA